MKLKVAFCSSLSMPFSFHFSPCTRFLQTGKDIMDRLEALRASNPTSPPINVVSVVVPEGRQLLPWEISRIVDEHGNIMPSVQNADIVVANFQRFQADSILDANNSGRGLPAGFFNLVILDEGHHLGANTYVKVVNHFCNGEGAANAHLTIYSATPERPDGRHNLPFLTLEWLYFMSKEHAWRNNYIKRFTLVETTCEAMVMAGEQPGEFKVSVAISVL